MEKEPIMEIEDEINQINSIINKLDVIRDDEWQKKEDETEEEFDNRLETIEEELEEELLDYISDSLLAEQEINEEEAIKEAQEKIKADYELFSDAFIKSDNGIITLKTEFIMIQIDRETFQMMLHQIMERFDRIDDRLNRMNRQTAALEGDKLLDNQDMCELLGVTKRTLARYRQKKLVTYYMIDGRTYYKASEVQDFLSRKGKVLPAKIKKELGIQF